MSPSMMKPQTEDEELWMQEHDVLTVEQIADYLQIHPETVRRWLRDGELRGMNLGGKGGWRIRRSEFERFMAEREEQR